MPFAGGYIPCAKVDGEPMVILRPVSDLLGLNWAGQYTKLTADPAACVEFISTQVPGDDQARKHLVVSLETFTVWLARLQPSRVKAGARRTVIDYQREAGRTLRLHFFGAPRSGRGSVEQITRRDLAAMVIEEADRADAAERRAAELEGPAESWEILAEAGGDYSLRDAAHILNRDPMISTGQNRLKKALRELDMIDRKGVPYARHASHLRERAVAYEHPRTGEPRLATQIRITIPGLEYLHRRLGGTTPLQIAEEA